MAENASSETELKRNQFGTFGGVFTPSILTILGVIMFLRTGYVVGEAGSLNAVVILLIAEAIVLITAFSMSAIATNTPVRGGGAYFLISRVLGPQFGGAIGIALYLAQALSVPFYILGFTESLVQSFSFLNHHSAEIALCTALVLFVVNFVGADWAIKSQYFVMALLVMAIVSFLGGGIGLFDSHLFHENVSAGYSGPDISFWVLFSVYFPAVTGILAGINMSGDLKDPSRSLVRGTFFAIAVGFIVYLAEIIICSGSQMRTDLIERPYQMLIQNALYGTGFLVMGGVFAATLSSAIGSFMGAPRVLQAVARDQVIPGISVFGRGTARGDEPRQALWLTLVVTVAVIIPATGENALQSFDAVASVVTMFFLCTYGMVNLAAFVESFGSNPSFRPRFRFYHWTVSLLGALMCLGVMVLIDAVAAAIAVIMIAGAYLFISKRVYSAAFGDARRGFFFSLIAKNMWQLSKMTPHPKNWRPTLLTLTGNPKTRNTLMQYAVWFAERRGIVALVQIIIGELSAMAKKRRESKNEIRKFLDDNNIMAYPEVIIAESLDEGIRLLVQAHSIGPLKPNTVMIGWPGDPERIAPFATHLRDIRKLERSVICVVDRGLPHPAKACKRIDIWWRGKENGSLMLILAFLISGNAEWKCCKIRILREVHDEESGGPAYVEMEQLAQAARVDAEIVILVSKESFHTVLHQCSSTADLVMLGFVPPEPDCEEEFHTRFNQMLEGLPTTILVNSSGEADLFA